MCKTCELEICSLIHMLEVILFFILYVMRHFCLLATLRPYIRYVVVDGSHILHVACSYSEKHTCGANKRTQVQPGWRSGGRVKIEPQTKTVCTGIIHSKL